MQYRRIIINPNDGYFRDASELYPTEKTNYRIHILLFIATLLSTTFIGAEMSGYNPRGNFHDFMKGLPFSLTLLLILSVHEFAHYFTARYWNIITTLPYFLPVPIKPIGTFGAVIKLKSSIPSRKALIDVGISGPLAGFIVAVIVSFIGLTMSKVVSITPSETTYSYILGESLLFKLLAFFVFRNVPANSDVLLHPIAYAGWIGLFVTALNLIPVGQLDGGHILFAVSPKIHNLLRMIRVPVLILMGVTLWPGWFVWAVLLMFIGKNHPYPRRMEPDIGLPRKILAAVSFIVFIICITPIPIDIR